jgi:hypothetical protein
VFWLITGFFVLPFAATLAALFIPILHRAGFTTSAGLLAGFVPALAGLLGFLRLLAHTPKGRWGSDSGVFTGVVASHVLAPRGRNSAGLVPRWGWTSCSKTDSVRINTSLQWE